MRRAILVGVVAALAWSSEANAKSCFWYGWERRAECECGNLGYKPGTDLFLQCYAVKMEGFNQQRGIAGAFGLMLLQPRPVPPSTNCTTTRFGNTFNTHCW